MRVLELTALALGAAIRDGCVSPAEAAGAALAAIAGQNPENNAFLTVAGEGALVWADGQPGPPPRSPLAGVPMALADNICTGGMKTTCASRLLEDFVPPCTATAAQRALDGGAVLLGKLNMDEFGIGEAGESSHFGHVKSPWGNGLPVGGAAGGAAAAVAAGECWYALASDTGGDIRLAAAQCGVTGLRPTYGTVSRYGLIAHAPSMDQIGPVCKTAADCAAVLDLLRGRDARDATSVSLPGGPLLELLDGDLRGVKIGLPEGCFPEELERERALGEAVQGLRARGAWIGSFSLPALRYAAPACAVTAGVEAASSLSRFDGVSFGRRAARYGDLESMYRGSRSEGLGFEAKLRVLFGTALLSEEGDEALCRRARQVREEVRSVLKSALSRFDLLLTPTAPPAHLTDGGEALSQAEIGCFTAPASLAGLPALSMPCGFSENGLPVGAQLIGPPLGDGLALRAAHAFQLDTKHHERRAP